MGRRKFNALAVTTIASASLGSARRRLPSDRCGRFLAGELKGKGYDVTFREFDGDHEIPGDIARQGLSWV